MHPFFIMLYLLFFRQYLYNSKKQLKHISENETGVEGKEE